MIRVEKKEYRGWSNAYFLSNDSVELVVLADVGPRVVSYSLLGGKNQFHEFPDQAGLQGGNEFRLYGGHRLWAWPEVERTYFPDNVAVQVATNPTGAIFTAPIGECRSWLGASEDNFNLAERTGNSRRPRSLHRESFGRPDRTGLVDTYQSCVLVVALFYRFRREPPWTKITSSRFLHSLCGRSPISPTTAGFLARISCN